MRMETLVLACTQKDLPLLNLDHIKAFGKETQLIELYDTGISEEKIDQEGFLKVKEGVKDVSNYEAGEHWYDEILLPCSYGKTGKGLTSRFEADCRSYFDLYMAEFDRLKDCDPKVKNEANRNFAQGLLDHGGPAVDQVRKMFGEEKTCRLIRKHMYGTE